MGSPWGFVELPTGKIQVLSDKFGVVCQWHKKFRKLQEIFRNEEENSSHKRFPHHGVSGGRWRGKHFSGNENVQKCEKTHPIDTNISTHYRIVISGVILFRKLFKKTRNAKKTHRLELLSSQWGSFIVRFRWHKRIFKGNYMKYPEIKPQHNKRC